MGRLQLLVIALALGTMAGCLAGEAPGETADPAQAPDAGEAETRKALALAGEDCWMGGAQSVHPREIPGWNVSSIVPDPWRVADVIEDTGEQYTYSEVPDPTQPKPEEGQTWGHYHATLTCQTWTLDGEPRPDLSFGFVGPKVQTPGFAEEGADDAYVATVIATDDDALYERLERHGIDAMHAETATARVGDHVDIWMGTDRNGNYRSIYRLNELGPVEDEHVRLWFQHENPDGTFSPIALELAREGGTHHGDQGEGYFHHAQTAHHWPLPGAYGHTAAAHYEGFDVSLEWGPTPNVTVEEEYVH